MSDGWVLVAVVGVSLVALAGGAIAMLVGVRNARARRERLARWAEARGWTLTTSVPALATRWSGHPFDTGNDPVAEHVLSGPYGAYEAVVFDFSYRVASQRDTLFDAALAVLATVIENVPGYVWSDRGATAPRPGGGGGS